MEYCDRYLAAVSNAANELSIKSADGKWAYIIVSG